MSSRRRQAAGQTALAEKQILAYLAARDVLRRIRRIHSLVEPLLARPRPAAAPDAGRAGR